MRFRIPGAIAATLLVLATGTTARAASGEVASEFYGAAAQARAATLSVAGHAVTLASGAAGGELDAVRGSSVLGAAGVGADVAPDSIVAVTAASTGSERCAVPQISDHASTLEVDADVTCGSAHISGSGVDVAATGIGRAAGVAVRGADVLSSLLRVPELAPILGETVGDLADIDGTLRDQQRDGRQAVAAEVDPVVRSGVGTLNGKLAALVGPDVLPNLSASDTLGNLIDRLTSAPLVALRLGEARAEVAGDAAVLTSRATNDGAVIEVLPGVLSDGTPLVRITVSASRAEVVYHRADASDEGSARSAEVRVESPLLATAEPVREGQTLRLFCEETALLCTEISVGYASEREVDGRLQVSAPLVSVTVAEQVAGGTASMVPAAPSGPDIPALSMKTPASLRQVEDVLGTVPVLGLPAASATTGSGVHIEVAGAVAQGGGAKVLGSSESIEVAEPFTGALPRTGGGAALPAAGASLLGLSAGVRALAGRRRP